MVFEEIILTPNASDDPSTRLITSLQVKALEVKLTYHIGCTPMTQLQFRPLTLNEPIKTPHGHWRRTRIRLRSEWTKNKLSRYMNPKTMSYKHEMYRLYIFKPPYINWRYNNCIRLDIGYRTRVCVKRINRSCRVESLVSFFLSSHSSSSSKCLILISICCDFWASIS